MQLNTDPLFKTIGIDKCDVGMTQWTFWFAYDRSCQYISSIKLLTCKALGTYIVKANTRPEIGL